MFKFDTLLGKSFFDIVKDLQTVYGVGCLSNGVILKWTNCFNDGRGTIKVDKHTGRPVTELFK